VTGISHPNLECTAPPSLRELSANYLGSRPDSSTEKLTEPAIKMSAEAVNEANDLSNQSAPAGKNGRKITNAFWEPFQQFKLLMFMLGSTAIVAVLLGGFLYYAFSELIGAVTVDDSSRSYYAEMVEMQLISLFKYCAALFILYVVLLAAVCVAYTHKMIGPLQPFNRHVDSMLKGDFSSRVVLRKNDLQTFNEFGDKLNQLAVNMDIAKRESDS